MTKTSKQKQKEQLAAQAEEQIEMNYLKKRLEYESLIRDINKAEFEKMDYFIKAQDIVGEYATRMRRQQEEQEARIREKQEAIQKAFEEASNETGVEPLFPVTNGETLEESSNNWVPELSTEVSSNLES